MSTFAEDIEHEAGDEPIETVVIGGSRGWQDEEDDPHVDSSKKHVVLTWAEARPWLDYEYYKGFGSSDCHSIYAYTTSRVIWVHEYDGSTSLASAPRNPEPCKPEMC